MSGTVDDASMKDQLPWLVNKSLERDAQTRLEAALSTDPSLAIEHEFLQRVRDAVCLEEGTDPGELGWRRLRRQIDAETQLRSGLRQRRTWQGFALAASLLLAVQVVWLHGTAPDQGAYEPMGTSPAIGGVLLQVRFSEQARLADVQELLQSQSLRVEAGPGVAGIWRLRLQNGDVDAVVSALQRNKALITFVAVEH
jgi:hypothetical protein